MKSFILGVITAIIFIFIAYGVVYDFYFEDFIFRSSMAIIGAYVYTFPAIGFPVKYEFGMLLIIITGIFFGTLVKVYSESFIFQK